MQKFSEKLKEIDALYDAYKARRPLGEDEKVSLYEKLRLDWTYNTNALEGNSLSLGETAFYLREGLTSEGKPLVDYLEARNHAEAIDWLFAVVIEKREISESFIKEMNALLHKGITERPARGADGQMIMRKINPGIYKTQPNHVLTISGQIHYYVEPLLVKEEIEKLVKLMGESVLRPVELAAATHYEFTRIHPFDACNGRCSRLLLNLILIRAGYPPIVIRTEERRRYLEALEAADNGNRESFYLFVAEHVEEMLRQ